MFTPVTNATTFYNATESTATKNFPTASYATRPITETSVSVQQGQPTQIRGRYTI